MPGLVWPWASWPAGTKHLTPGGLRVAVGTFLLNAVLQGLGGDIPQWHQGPFAVSSGHPDGLGLPGGGRRHLGGQGTQVLMEEALVLQQKLAVTWTTHFCFDSFFLSNICP